MNGTKSNNQDQSQKKRKKQQVLRLSSDDKPLVKRKIGGQETSSIFLLFRALLYELCDLVWLFLIVNCITDYSIVFLKKGFFKILFDEVLHSTS